MIATRARVVFALFLLCLLGALITGDEVIFNLVYVLGGLLLLSWLWSRTSLLGLTLSRQPKSIRAQVGRMFVETFILRNRSRFSKLWVEVDDLSDLPGYKITPVSVWLGLGEAGEEEGHRSSTVTLTMGPGHHSNWTVRTLCSRRGRFRLGPTQLRSGDPFGLFPVQHDLPLEQHLVVLPMTVPIWQFPLPSGRLPGGDALRQRTHQTTPNASGVRDYAPGDSYSRIHWPSTAKRQRLIVKEFEFDPLADVWIMLDAAVGTQFTLPDSPRAEAKDPFSKQRFQLPPSSEEYAVSVAASLALHFLEHDRAVGLVAYGAARHVIQPDHGESQLYRILESLAVLEAVGEHPLDNVIKVEGPRIPRGASVILITTGVGSDLIGTIRGLDYGGRRSVLVLLDAESFGGPSGSKVIQAAAVRMGIPLRVVRHGEPLEQALRGSMARRSVRPAA